MELESALPLAMFGVLLLGIMSGFPVAFVLLLTGTLFGFLGFFFEIFLLTDFGFLPSRLYGLMSNFTLLAVPLFIFMGIVLERSGLAGELLETTELILRKLRSGLPISLVAVGALLAASTGIVGATVVTMGVISLPRMIERGFDHRLATGTIAASGTLGQIIPPSIVLILLADMMNLAVADLFAAAILPGALLVLSYIVYIICVVSLKPSLVPSQPTPNHETTFPLLCRRAVSSLFPPVFLMILVIGTILLGVASPTESAACGAFGALLLCMSRRRLSFAVLRQAVHQTTSVTAMVFTLLVGAQVFSIVFRGLYGDDVITDFVVGLESSETTILFFVLLLLFVLGFFLDFMEICFIVVPIITPLLTLQFGVDGLWLAVLIAINLQTSFLTPPFGFALFYLKGVCPPSVTTGSIYAGAIPFVFIQLLVLGIIWAFPPLATALPDYFFGK